jgi:hypothetical protein
MLIDIAYETNKKNLQININKGDRKYDETYSNQRTKGTRTTRSLPKRTPDQERRRTMAQLLRRFKMNLIQTNEQKAREQRVHYQSEHLIKKGEEQWLNY